MKPLLVGELNPYGEDSVFALYPLPEGSAGWRLCALVLGMKRREYLARFDRANLCTGKWSMKAAREKVAEILWLIDRPAMVLLGKKVCDAFRFDFKPFTIQYPLPIDDSARFPNIVILPHPSGRCRAWNEPGAFERARVVLREAGVL